MVCKLHRFFYIIAIKRSKETGITNKVRLTTLVYDTPCDKLCQYYKDCYVGNQYDMIKKKERRKLMRLISSLESRNVWDIGQEPKKLDIVKALKSIGVTREYVESLKVKSTSSELTVYQIRRINRILRKKQNNIDVNQLLDEILERLDSEYVPVYYCGKKIGEARKDVVNIITKEEEKWFPTTIDR